MLKIIKVAKTDSLDILGIAKKTIKIEAEALQVLYQSLDNDFENCISILQESKGRIIVTGIGKSALVGQKIVATLNSTGSQAMFMHAADAVHGDLGMVDKNDVVICISKSGSTSELQVLVPILKSYGLTILAMTAEKDSFLASQAHGLLYTPISEEADPNKLAPTSSTTVQSAMGDAVAVTLLSGKGFTPEHFAKFHPGGSLGKQLYLKVEDLIINNSVPKVQSNTEIKEILLNMSKNRLGATVVVDSENIVKGIITDGDIRRWFQKDSGEGAFAQNIMTADPKHIDCQSMAIDAFELMRSNNISQLPVTKNEKYIGVVHINDLLREGFV